MLGQADRFVRMCTCRLSCAAAQRLTSPCSAPSVCLFACCRALQQEKQGFVGADGAYHPPRWQLREMLIRGMHHLL